MHTIGTPFGVILKFESLSDLEKVAGGLMRMHGWAEAVWDKEPGHPVKLAYIVKPDNLSPEDKEWLDNFTDSLADAKQL